MDIRIDKTLPPSFTNAYVVEDEIVINSLTEKTIIETLKKVSPEAHNQLIKDFDNRFCKIGFKTYINHLIKNNIEIDNVLTAILLTDKEQYKDLGLSKSKKLLKVYGESLQTKNQKALIILPASERLEMELLLEVLNKTSVLIVFTEESKSIEVFTKEGYSTYNKGLLCFNKGCKNYTYIPGESVERAYELVEEPLDSFLDNGEFEIDQINKLHNVETLGDILKQEFEALIEVILESNLNKGDVSFLEKISDGLSKLTFSHPTLDKLRSLNCNVKDKNKEKTL